MGPRENAVRTVFEDLRGTNPTGREVDQAVIAYLRRMNGRRPDVETVMELGDAVREMLDEEPRCERHTLDDGECPFCGEEA